MDGRRCRLPCSRPDPSSSCSSSWRARPWTRSCPLWSQPSAGLVLRGRRGTGLRRPGLLVQRVGELAGLAGHGVGHRRGAGGHLLASRTASSPYCASSIGGHRVVVVPLCRGPPATGDHRPGGADRGAGREQPDERHRPPVPGLCTPRCSLRALAAPSLICSYIGAKVSLVVTPAAVGGCAGPVVGRGDLLGRAAGQRAPQPAGGARSSGQARPSTAASGWAAACSCDQTPVHLR